MIDIPLLLSELATARPVFHSEADFQHALAWQIHTVVPGAEVRLEYRVSVPEPIYLDVWVRTPEGNIALELKSPTRKLECIVAGEEFALRNQSAQDLRRYDFIKDIARLERVVATFSGTRGYALLLTNDSSFWNKSRSDATVDAAFRIHEGATLSGMLPWADHTGTGTMTSRERALVLNTTYSLAWRDYSLISGAASQSRFRYLLVAVEAVAGNGHRAASVPQVVSEKAMTDNEDILARDIAGLERVTGLSDKRERPTNNRTGTHADQIMRAVAALIAQGQDIFAQLEVREQIGVDRDVWARGYSAIFQAMRVDHPGGAPPIAPRYRGVFRQVEHGRHTLTPYGRELLDE